MKLPTLIVRLIGIYLVVNCTIGLIQIHNMESMVDKLVPANPALAGLSLYCWLGLAVGITATLLAGILARLLTFDSELGGRSRDFSDRFMSK